MFEASKLLEGGSASAGFASGEAVVVSDTMSDNEAEGKGNWLGGFSREWYYPVSTQLYPRRSMYGIFTYIYHQNYPDVGK